ncbi:MAG: flagellar brake protein [Moraxellaceae bacterium]|nr:MAG: flagellar brake protein [Moraxellaceae bacterium]
MKFEDMKLTYGYPLQLQTSNSSGQPERFSCRLIGCLPGRSILLSVPKLAGKLVRFRPGQKLVARLMVDNGIGIFVSVVEVQTPEPYPILHIGYPGNVSFKGIRGATRVGMEQSVDVTNLTGVGNRCSSGTLVDMSITGARIETDGELIGEIGDKIQITMEVNIADIVRNLSVDAIIRSRIEGAQIDNKQIAYGVQFAEVEEDKRLLLYAYVYSLIGNDEVIN